MPMMTWRAAALPLLLCVSSAPAAQWQAKAASRCDGIKIEAEKAVCADPRLAKLDSRLAGTWKSYLNAFDDEQALSTLRREQAAWVARRDECKSDVDCIAKAYGERQRLLSGKQAGRRFAGVYESPAGNIAVYPVDGLTYLVSIRTADQNEGTWICEMYGTALGFDKSLAVSVDSTTFTAVLRGGALKIEPTEAIRALELQRCGLNGSISFTYAPGR